MSPRSHSDGLTPHRSPNVRCLCGFFFLRSIFFASIDPWMLCPRSISDVTAQSFRWAHAAPLAKCAVLVRFLFLRGHFFASIDPWMLCPRSISDVTAQSFRWAHAAPLAKCAVLVRFLLWRDHSLLQSIPGCCAHAAYLMSPRSHSGGLTPHRSPNVRCLFGFFFGGTIFYFNRSLDAVPTQHI